MQDFCSKNGGHARQATPLAKMFLQTGLTAPMCQRLALLRSRVHFPPACRWSASGIHLRRHRPRFNLCAKPIEKRVASRRTTFFDTDIHMKKALSLHFGCNLRSVKDALERTHAVHFLLTPRSHHASASWWCMVLLLMVREVNWV